jgi:putative transposase
MSTTRTTTPWSSCCGWPIINIEDKRGRGRTARRQETGKRSDQPARLVEGQRVMGWREALNELDDACPGRLR